MSRINKKVIIIAIVVLVFSISIIGYFIYDHFKYQEIFEKDGVRYGIVPRRYAVILDGKKAKKSEYTFDFIKGLPIKEIEENAFKDNKKITTITAYHLDSVSSGCFENSTIENFSLVNTNQLIFVDIYKNAFKNCENLKSVILGSTHLYNDAFLNCGEFALKISSRTRLGDSYAPTISAFRNTTLKSIEIIETEEKYLRYENGVLYVKDSWSISSEERGMRKFFIYLNKDVEEITIEDKTKFHIFYGASTKPLKLNISENHIFYTSVDGAIYDKNRETLYYYPCNLSTKEFPSSLTTIAKGAFFGDYGGKSLILPNTTQIKAYSFVYVTGLTMDFKYSKINDSSFYECDFVYENVDLPSKS